MKGMRLESELLQVIVSLKQGCVMSPWLFNMYLNGVVREVGARMMEWGVALKMDEGAECGR